MNGKFGILSLVAAVALAATSGTALAGPKHGRGDDRGRGRDRDCGREVHCRPKPPVCRPAPRCDDRPRYGHHRRECETRRPRGGFVIVIGGNRHRHCD